MLDEDGDRKKDKRAIKKADAWSASEKKVYSHNIPYLGKWVNKEIDRRE
ncbi:hypothetical protein AMI01nite_55500 [Aneurinibacillus migulanus]|nr:hypothetical protein AMI01nite_55500 [Aneurinibacillus migulanus]